MFSCILQVSVWPTLLMGTRVTPQESHNPANPFRLSKDLPINPISTEVFATARHWIEVCTMTHGRCQARDKTFAPSRLVEVMDDEGNHVRLCSPKQPVRFAALSYCWGSTTQPSTTMGNVSARYTELDSSILPQTLHDAVAAT
jgi:hypothetical protein